MEMSIKFSLKNAQTVIANNVIINYRIYRLNVEAVDDSDNQLSYEGAIKIKYIVVFRSYTRD